MKTGILIFLIIASTLTGTIFFLKFNMHLTKQEKIILAIMKNDSVRLKELIKNGYNLNFEIDSFHRKKYTSILIKYLPEQIQKNFNLNCFSGRETPLSCAIFRRNYGLLKLLIDEGANVNYLDSMGNSPLYYSELVGPKCHHYCDKNSYHVNEHMQHWRMQKLLLQNGAEEIRFGLIEIEELKEELPEEDPIANDEGKSNEPYEVKSYVPPETLIIEVQ